MGITNTAILLFDLAMLVSSAALVQRGELTFDGALIAVLALFSSFGPTVALANLGATLQNTFAAGNRVLDILDEVRVKCPWDRKQTNESLRTRSPDRKRSNLPARRPSTSRSPTAGRTFSPTFPSASRRGASSALWAAVAAENRRF